jgi:NADPH:quinone reductase-like Zn-dependent oxidoreductase
MLDFVKTHSVDVKPEKGFQLSEMRKAHEYLGSSRSFGKVVVMSE